MNNYFGFFSDGDYRVIEVVDEQEYKQYLRAVNQKYPKAFVSEMFEASSGEEAKQKFKDKLGVHSKQEKEKIEAKEKEEAEMKRKEEAVKMDENKALMVKIFKWGAAVVGVILAIILCTNLFKNLSADKVMCIQNPITGSLTWYTEPGLKWQGFGKVTKFEKLETYEFQIPVRFNDGGHGTVVGSINYEVPLDVPSLTSLLQKYGSQEAIQKNLVEVVTNKCVYMTGPLMSSKESYAEKRTSLIFYIEDQIKNGVYRTTQEEVKTKDPITGADKTITVAKIVIDKDGKPMRQEDAILTGYGIKTSNFAVTKLPYDDAVEKQITQQQGITMSVQTAMAQAKEAEQNAITVGKQGEANAAKAKWEQEVVKAKAVVEAQQQLEVATLQKQAAAQEKEKQIMLGEGEATRKKLVMAADGALEKKIEALVAINSRYAQAMEAYKGAWVPSVVMNDAKGATAGSGANDLIELLKAKSAKELSIDMTIPDRKKEDK